MVDVGEARIGRVIGCSPCDRVEVTVGVARVGLAWKRHELGAARELIPGKAARVTGAASSWRVMVA